jgi:hypothetical protein
MPRQPIGERAMSAAERQRKSRSARAAANGVLPAVSLDVTPEEVVDTAAGYGRLDSLWSRELCTATEALHTLYHIAKRTGFEGCRGEAEQCYRYFGRRGRQR